MDNKRKAIIISVILVVLIITASWFFVFRTKYYTAGDLYGTDLWFNDQLLGKVYHFKDTVLEVNVFYLPEIDYTSPFDSENMQVNLSNIKPYTAVTFDSPTIDGKNKTAVYFEGNITSKFPIEEEVKFSLEVKYYDWYLEPIQNLEPHHITQLMVIYEGGTLSGLIPYPIEYDVVKSDDLWQLHITKITEFFPNPVKWNTITLSTLDNSTYLNIWEKIPFKVYDVEGNLIGESNDTDMIESDNYIEVGSVIEFAVNESYPDTWRVLIEKIWLDTDIRYPVDPILSVFLVDTTEY